MFATLPPATRGLILANIAVFVLQQLTGNLLPTLFALWPLGSRLLQPWQLVSYAFLHGNLSHIFLNMFALFMFGRALEDFWGSRRFTVYYFACVLSAAVIQLWVEQATHAGEPVIGASGGIFGLLLAFAWYFPRQRIMLLFPPIPMPAWLFVTLYGVAELWFGLRGTASGVAHFAHLGGMLGGALVILYWRSRPAVYRY